MILNKAEARAAFDMHPSIHAKSHPDKPAYVMAASGEEQVALWGVGRALEPGRASVPRARAGRWRLRRLVHGQQRPLLRGPVGRAAFRAALHLHFLEADRGRGRVHRPGQRAPRCSASPSAGVAQVAAEPGAAHRRRPALSWSMAATTALRELRRGARSPPCRRTPIAEVGAGSAMLYSSGTTGRPKGAETRRRGERGPDRRAQWSDHDGPGALRLGF